MPRSRKRLASVVAAIWIGATLLTTSLSAAWAEGELPAPAGEVLLSIQGNVGKRNADSGAQLDFAMLESIGFVTRTITTQWTPSAVFQGVSGKDLVEYLDIDGDYLLAIAHDDYEVSIPLSDLIKHDTVFAVSMDGERLSIKNKGPVWLVYANDNRPSISPELLNARMIWQLHTLVSQ